MTIGCLLPLHNSGISLDFSEDSVELLAKHFVGQDETRGVDVHVQVPEVEVLVPRQVFVRH